MLSKMFDISTHIDFFSIIYIWELSNFLFRNLHISINLFNNVNHLRAFTWHCKGYSSIGSRNVIITALFMCSNLIYVGFCPIRSMTSVWFSCKVNVICHISFSEIQSLNDCNSCTYILSSCRKDFKCFLINGMIKLSAQQQHQSHACRIFL